MKPFFNLKISYPSVKIWKKNLSDLHLWFGQTTFVRRYHAVKLTKDKTRVAVEYSKNVQEQRSASRLQTESFHRVSVRCRCLSTEIRARLLRPSRVAGERIHIGKLYTSIRYDCKPHGRNLENQKQKFLGSNIFYTLFYIFFFFTLHLLNFT